MIAPVGEKLLFEHTKFSATRGGGVCVGVIYPVTTTLDPPLTHVTQSNPVILHAAAAPPQGRPSVPLETGAGVGVEQH